MADEKKLEANLSTLILSIGSSAAIALGLAPNPATGKIDKDLDLARFNIDLLDVISQKTRNNLTDDEKTLLEKMTTDLQLRFVQTRP